MDTSKMKLVAFADAYHGTIADIEDTLCIYAGPAGLVGIIDNDLVPVEIAQAWNRDTSRDGIDTMTRWIDVDTVWTIDMESIKYL